MHPRVSVAIPLYNKKNEIERCLRSILAQTVSGFEVVIVDDGSTDGSADKVMAFTDPRIRLIRQANAGVARARNRAIEEAATSLIAFIDADDEWLPGHLENLLRLVETAPEAGLYFTAYWVDRGGGMRRRVRLTRRHQQANGLVKDYFSAPDGTMSLPTATAVRKEAIRSAGGFRQMFGEDVDVFLRLAAMVPVAYSQTATAVWHIDAGNRRCVDQKVTVKLYEPGSLQPSLDFLAKCPTVSPESLSRARRYVAERERRAILTTLLQGQREHAQSLLERWQRDFGECDRRLARLIRWTPGGVLRLWARLRNASGKAATAMAYAREWRVNRRTFRRATMQHALSS